MSIRRMISFSMIPLAYLLSGPLSEKVFAPLLVEGGPLVNSLGHVFGIGPGRGFGLMFSTFGLIYLLVAQLIFFNPHVRNVELVLPDAVSAESE
jgi:DHA3 family macrolide efflux protein-like MFS transporter